VLLTGAKSDLDIFSKDGMFQWLRKLEMFFFLALFLWSFHFEIAKHQSAGKKWWPQKILKTLRKKNKKK